MYYMHRTAAQAVAACADSPTLDLEPDTVGVYDDSILGRLDTLLAEAAARGLKVRTNSCPV